MYAEHSISTSVFNGSVFTATQVRTYTKSHTPSASSVFKILLLAEIDSTYRLRLLAEPLTIDLIHSGEVVHVRKENVNLDDLLEAGASLFKHGFKVTENLRLKADVPSVTFIITIGSA